MSKLIRLVVLLAVVAGGALGVYVLVRRAGESHTAQRGEGGIRVEEKYGFTTETVQP